MQKRLYFLKIKIVIIQVLIKTFTINLNYLIKCALQQSRKLLSLFHRQQNASRTLKSKEHEYTNQR